MVQLRPRFLARRGFEHELYRDRRLQPRVSPLRGFVADLAANPASCTLIYGHHPYYTVGPHDRTTELRPFWELAYNQEVDLWLVGHDHNYQRLAPQDPDGNLDPQRGIPQILVGSGGVVHTTPVRVGSTPNLVVENHDTYGIIELSLGQGSYGWEFHPEAGPTFTDTGTGSCH